MNILLVDDEVVIIRILKETIDWKELGVDRTFSACNAVEAKEIFEKNAIDLTICDIEMPQENGLALLSWIHKLYPRTLNIILTAYADFSYAQSAISIGVYQFLLKPIVFDNLKRVVCRAVEKIRQDALEDKYREIGEYLSAETPTGRLIGWNDSPNAESSESIVRNVRKYVEEHYNEEISRQDIERFAHMNQDYLNRLFKESSGYPLMEYIQIYRISVAKYLLLHTNLSIADIASQTGHNSPSYFSKLFRRWVKTSPAEFRNANHNSSV